MYSYAAITLKTEADSLLKMAKRDKRIYQHRKETLEIRHDDSAEDTTDRQADLAEANADLAAVEARIAALPEGDKKEQAITKKMALEVKVRNLSQGSAGAVAQLTAEYDEELLDRQLAAIDEFISALDDLKPTLK